MSTRLHSPGVDDAPLVSPRHTSDEESPPRKSRLRRSEDDRHSRDSDGERRRMKRRRHRDDRRRGRRVSSSDDDDDSRKPRRKRSKPTTDDASEKPDDTVKASEAALSLTRAGGAYIPPARLKQMMAQSSDKCSEAYQRMNWERLKKRIHGQVNKVNVDNIVAIVRELLQENVIRGK